MDISGCAKSTLQFANNTMLVSARNLSIRALFPKLAKQGRGVAALRKLRRIGQDLPKHVAGLGSVPLPDEGRVAAGGRSPYSSARPPRLIHTVRNPKAVAPAISQRFDDWNETASG